MLKKLLLGVVAVASLAFAALSVSSVLAHSRPIRFAPAPGAVLEAAPARIDGWFTSDLRRADESFIRVFDAEGSAVAVGEIELSTDRRQMAVALTGAFGPGRYLVHWSTLDDEDGEVFAGCFTFFVGTEAATAALADGVALDGGADCPAVAGGAAGDEEHGPEGTAVAAAEIELAVSIDGADATLALRPLGFTTRAPTGSGRDPEFGHYQIYLDTVPLDVLTGHAQANEDQHDDGAMAMDADHAAGEDGPLDGGLIENPAMWVEDEFSLTDLAPGRHTVSVAAFYDDHSPFSPPVVTAETFTIAGGDGDGGVPVWVLALGIGGALVVGGVGSRLVGKRA